MMRRISMLSIAMAVSVLTISAGAQTVDAARMTAGFMVGKIGGAKLWSVAAQTVASVTTTGGVAFLPASTIALSSVYWHQLGAGLPTPYQGVTPPSRSVFTGFTSVLAGFDVVFARQRGRRY